MAVGLDSAEGGCVTAAAERDIDTDEEWKLLAACRNHPEPDLWFPDSASREAAAEAIWICGACAVKDECLGYATKHRIPYGIWGGQRQNLRPGGFYSRWTADERRRRQARSL